MTVIGRVAVLSLFGAGLLGAAGCATAHRGEAAGETWTMNAGPKLPAAEGKVKVRVDENGDHVVELSFQHLAPAGRAFDGTTMYMVWLVPASAPPQPIGSLDVGDDLNARMSITTPNENFDVLVTAEVNAYAATPGRNRAFTIAIRSAS